MKTLFFALLLTTCIGRFDLPVRDAPSIAIRYPASASDLANFYRAIQALSGNPYLNETAVAIV